MKNFRDVSALHDSLRVVYEQYPGEPGRAVFAAALEKHFEFTKDQASLYASTVLSLNVDSSADWVASHAGAIARTWVRGTMSGMAAAWLNTMQETWQFSFDLSYEHKRERYEGYVSPFQTNYSRSTPSIETGIWAPSDRQEGDRVYIVAISSSGWARRLEFVWIDLNKEELFHGACSIDGERFTKQL